MPLDSNFGFYSTHDFHSNTFYDISECLLSSDKSFSLINNCNIRNQYQLILINCQIIMLSELNFPFSVIGLTEIKQKIGESPISNTDLYQFLSHPSLSNAGGVTFYLNNS